MLGSSARLLRTLALFQTQRSWTGQALAERLEVTTRTLRRDVDKLRSLGYPIHSSTGLEGGYQMGAGAEMPPLLLDDDEVVAVALGLSFAARESVSGLEESSLRALAKMEQLMPPRLARRVAVLRATVVSRAPGGSEDRRVNTALLMTLAQACRDRQVARFRYRDAKGAAAERETEPHRLVRWARSWYLVAWDRVRSDWRTFRLDRLEGRVSTGENFIGREPPAADIVEYVSRGAAYAGRCRARVEVKTSAEELERLLPAGVGVIEPRSKRTCWFETGGSTWESLALHLAFLPVEFHVPAEYAELRAALATVARRLTRAAQ